MWEIEADSPQDADYAAGQMIHTYLQQWDYDYVEDATIYDEDGEEVETAWTLILSHTMNGVSKTDSQILMMPEFLNFIFWKS